MIARPLKLAPRLDPKPWGGRRLESLGKRLPPGPIGESLESGSDALVVGGPFDGWRLGDLARSQPAALLGSLGEAVSRRCGEFPLLVKFIDASQHLSVQVHPGDADAPAGKCGKSEAWLILASDDGSEIIVGVDGRPDMLRIEQQVVRVEVRPGDVFFVPAGTVHAIGGGVMLYEVQQPSDVTYRLFDWRRDREMHVAEGLAAARDGQRAERVTPLRVDDGRELLVACRHFALERRRWSDGSRVEERPGSCRVLTLLEGQLRFDELEAVAGDSLVLPADLPDAPVDGTATTLIAWIPDLARDVVALLHTAGFGDDEIARLGDPFGRRV